MLKIKQGKNEGGGLITAIIVMGEYALIISLALWLYQYAQGDLTKKYNEMESYYAKNLLFKKDIDNEREDFNETILKYKQGLSHPKISEDEQLFYKNISVLQDKLNENKTDKVEK